MTPRRVPSWFDRLDRRVTETMARFGVPFLRISLGIVFFWFGVLKFFPGLSPADQLASRTISALTLGIMPADAALLVLAVWECAIGLGLILGVFLRLTLLLLFLQMLGTFTPLLLF
ncbi:MAG: DoxX family membrane protein, partial [Chloroflexota bacterium]|nr:DoxX family membrane protein [Chloroflexota bacterium]